MKYLAVLGRQPLISVAELESLFENVKLLDLNLTEFESDELPNIDRLGGTLKLAKPLPEKPLEFLKNLPDGKIVLGISDYSKKATQKGTWSEALKLKKILVRHGRSVRIVPNKSPILASATSYHNHLGNRQNCIELIKYNNSWFSVFAVQNIDAYVKRDQARPSRDAKVGMLPPKLAQILINLCGKLPEDARILDPFCGTGVVLQEALLMGYTPYGTDLSQRMIDYTNSNLRWLLKTHPISRDIQTAAGDATFYQWNAPIDAIACESYLGPPMSSIPDSNQLRAAKQECSHIILSFLRNLHPQIPKNTPIAIATPAWLRTSGRYSSLKILDEIEKMGYNVKKYNNLRQSDLLYHREGQIVAREIIVLRKK